MVGAAVSVSHTARGSILWAPVSPSRSPWTGRGEAETRALSEIPVIAEERERKRQGRKRGPKNYMAKSILVTVGTTQFDALCRAIQSDDFQGRAIELGYSKIILQHGRGSPFPGDEEEEQQQLLLLRVEEDEEGEGRRRRRSRKRKEIQWETFDFTTNMAGYVAGVDVVISHCGSGTVLDVLRGPIFGGGESPGRRPILILVPNPLLMDNHQGELAEALASIGVALLSPAHGPSLADKLTQATTAVSSIANANANAFPAPAIGQLSELMRRTIGG